MNTRALAQAQARSWLEKGVVVLDLETTGLGPQDVAIDIAVLDVSGRVLLESLVQLPVGVGIAERALAVHGLRPEYLMAHGTPFNELNDRLADVLRGRVVVAHNSEFDSRLLNQTCRVWGCEIMRYDWQCTMLLSQQAMGTRKWPRLEEAAAWFDIKALGIHRARVDAETCRGVLLRIAGVI